MAFIQLTSPLILAGDPTLPNHAATKQYVDNKANNIDAAGFSSGLLNVMRLPALVGDVTMAAGSGTLVLTTTGVNPGTYTKVVLNTSGRITVGGTLAAEDMPNISWGKITSGLPTTLAGYGITNVIGMSGGTITGTLTSSATPSASLHLVTKSYVDSMIQPSGESLATGDIVRKGIVSTSPSGFLRANGGKVSKVTYSGLYSVLGDRYEIILQDGSETPWARQSAINRTGSLILNSAVNHVVATQSGYEVFGINFVTKNRVYFSNIPEGSYPTPKFKTATLNPDGTIATLNNVDISPTGDLTHGTPQSFFITKNKVWWLLWIGYRGTGNLYKSTINADGTVNRFTLHSSAPWLISSTKTIRVKNRMYFFDVQLGASSGAMEWGFSYIDANEDVGSVNSLGTVHPDIPKGRIIDVFVHKSKLYILTWTQPSGSTVIKPYYASINSDGTLSSWTAGPSYSDPPGGPNGVNPVGGKVLSSSSGVSYICAGVGEYVTYKPNPANSETWYQKLTFPIVSRQMNMDANGIITSWSPLVSVINPGIWVGSYSYFYPFITNGKMTFPGSGYNNQSATFVQFDFIGGTNDYSPYYDGSYTVRDPNNFYLPDFTSKETANTKYYVKT